MGVAVSPDAAWKIWVDTGGTFTDCIAVDPSGATHRCKVLSNGSLRDRVERIDPDGSIALRDAGKLPPGFLRGFRLSVLGSSREVEVVGHRAPAGTVQLTGGRGEGLSVGSPVELRSGEEAPLLAARLVRGSR